jgi:hypothetical protein
MDDPRIDDVVARYRVMRLEQFRRPAIELFESRTQNSLPPSVRQFFQLGDRLFGSAFVIGCGIGLSFRVQNFTPLSSATIDACERREWRFLDMACGDEGERLLVSLDQKPRVFVEWESIEPLEDTGVEFADFLAEVERAVPGGRAAELPVAPDCGGTM